MKKECVLAACLMLFCLAGSICWSQTVQDLSLGTELPDQVLGSGDVKYYKVVLETNASLLAMMRGSTYQGYYSLIVRKGSIYGPAVGWDYVAGDNTYEKSVEVTEPEPGEYYIEVRSYAGADITFTILADIRSVETLSLGTEINDQPLWCYGDVKYYKVTVTEDSPLLTMARWSDYRVNYWLFVHQGSIHGPIVGWDYVAGDNTYDSSVQVNDPIPGDYYIEIRNWIGSRSFSLIVDTRPAVPLALGEEITDQPLWGVGDVKYYKVTLTDNSTFQAMLRGSDKYWNYGLTIHKGSITGPVVGQLLNGGDNAYEVTSEIAAPDPGDYYIEVRNWTGQRTYSLLVDTHPAQPLALGTQLDDQFLWGLSDVKFYKVTLTDNSTFMAMLRGTDRHWNYGLVIHKGSVSGPPVGQRYNGGDNSCETTVEIAAPAPGDYYIEVRNWLGPHTYSLIADTRPVVPLPPSVQMDNQSLWGVCDVRYYKATVTCTNRMTVYVAGDSTYWKYGVSVHRGSKYGPVVGETVYADGMDTTIEVQMPDPGDYYIEVRNNSTGSRFFSVWQEMSSMSIAQAKQNPLDSPIDCSTGIIAGASVTAVFGDDFYVESDNRACGIQVNYPGHGFSIGQRVDLKGTVGINGDGERIINASYAVHANGSNTIAPLAMPCKSVGGDDWFYDQAAGAGQRGVDGGYGINNIGLLIRTMGQITESDTGWIKIDDGSGVSIKCLLPDGVEADPGWQYVTVTGISSCEKVDGKINRLIRIRKADDISPV